MAKKSTKIAKVDIESLIPQETIIPTSMSDEISDAILNYAVEVISDRALPNIYDGLKPVQRKILFEGLYKKYLSNGSFIKCAKYVGSVLGDTYVHGDASIYMALTALAQPWIQRYPLIDFHGNVGSYDGDEPAHMRYCVTGDTLINTNYGLIKIEELAVTSSNNDVINQLYGDDVPIDYVIESKDKQNKAIRLFNSGKHKIIHIITENNYELKGTLNHPVIANGDWKVLRDITWNDKILFNIKTNQIGSEIDLIDERNLEAYIDTNIDNIDRILQSSKKIQQLFLQKYFDRFAVFDNNILICPINNEEICQQVQILLLTFGVVCNRNNSKLIITDYLKNFSQYVDLIKQKPILDEITKDIPLINDDFVELAVNGVYVEEEEQTVYSVKVDSECHSFTANGIINHNTEAKLTKLAETTLNGINNNAVDMVPNFSETLDEPVVLPGIFPALLCNGSYGIAVGYTANIPAHNLNEVVDAIIAYIKNNNISLDELMKIIPGPDIATGSLLVNNEEIKKLYSTGKGNLSFKAKYHIDEENNAIIIDEIPPRVNKLKLVEKLRDLCCISKKIPRVLSVNDLSTDKTYIMIKLAKNAIMDLTIKSLFDMTDLSTNISYIMRAIYYNKPILFTLKQALQFYVEHRRNCLSRENLTLLDKAEKKKHTLLGLIALTKNIKKAISIIENSDDDTAALQQLKTVFNLDDVQAEAILEVKLRRLTKLNRDDLLNNVQSLDADITIYTDRKNNINLIDDLIIQQCNELKKKFGDSRRTQLIEVTTESVEDNVHDVVLILTNKNNIKVFSKEDYKAIFQSGTLKEKTEIYAKVINARSNDLFVVILENGTYMRLDFNTLISWSDKIKIISIYPISIEESANDELTNGNNLNNKNIIILTAFGLIQKIKLSAFKARLNKPVAIFKNWIDNDNIIFSQLVESANNNVISLITTKGLLHRFYESSLKETLTVGKNGVTAINLDNDCIVSAAISTETAKYIVIYTKHDNSYGRKIIDASAFAVKARNGKGIASISFYKKNPGVIYSLVVNDNIYVDIDNKGKLQLVDINKLTIGSRTSKPEDIDYDPIVINFRQ